MKILHLPTAVAGNPLGLSKAEQKIGVDSRCLYANPENKYEYHCDLLPVACSLHKLGFFGKAASLFATFLKHRTEFDVFHFNAGHTLLDYYKLNLNYMDLPFYSKNKKLIMTFNGSDARQPISSQFFGSLDEWSEENSYNHLYNDPKLNKIKVNRIKKIDQYVDHIFTVNPDLFRFLPARTKFLPYTISSWDEISFQDEVIKNKKLRIIHAPSNREIKGTAYIIEALNKLQKHYRNIEVIFVENVPNKEALALYKTADLIIDQLLIGWYGGVAIEVMKMGKPVMVFIRKSDLQYIPPEMAESCLETFLIANPTNIYEKLCLIAENPQLLQRHSELSLDYVHQWHDPLKVAKYLTNFYEFKERG
jgi:hypothetical protein